MTAAIAAAGVAGLAAWQARRRDSPAPGDRRELVVLVHGMGRSPLSMLALGRRLRRAGYRVLNWGYAGRRDAAPRLGARLAERLRADAGDAPAVHFVGHSLGCIIVRWALAHAPGLRAGRVVMLAPPNRGAAAADRYAPLVGWLMPQIRDLVTDERAGPRAIPPRDDVEVGIVAGLRDGKVRVSETRLEGARDHVIVPATHSFLMHRPDVHALVLRFLRDGRFSDGTG